MPRHHICAPLIYSKIHLLASILVVPGSQLGEVFQRFSALVVDQVFIHLDQYFEFLPPPPPRGWIKLSLHYCSWLLQYKGESLRVIDADIEAASMEVDEGHVRLYFPRVFVVLIHFLRHACLDHVSNQWLKLMELQKATEASSLKSLPPSWLWECSSSLPTRSLCWDQKAKSGERALISEPGWGPPNTTRPAFSF